MKPTRTLCSVFMGLGIALGWIDPGGAQQQRFGDVTEVVAVEVPVQVIKDGNPVSGLTAADFEIVDGRKKREITGFQEIDLALLSPDPATGIVPDLPVTARRHFLFLFDLSFSQPEAVTKARTAALSVVAEHVHASDLMAVGTYAASKGFRLIVGFTSDREQVEYAIETLGLADPLPQVNEPLGLLIADLIGQSTGGSPPSTLNLSGQGGGGSATEAVGRTGGDRASAFILAALRDLQGLSGQTSIDQQKNQMLALTSSMETIADLLRSVDGRVQVIMLSEGFDTSVMLGNQGLTQEERDQMAARADAIAQGRTWEVTPDQTYGSSAALSGMNRMLEEFRKADAVINTVDIGGLRVGGTVDRGNSQDKDRSSSLFVMADGTGGEFIHNFNDLGLAMDELLERTSITYLLAFQPEDLKWDGDYHRLKVKLKGGPKGARLIHRPGYYAPKPFGEQTPIERRMAAAGLVMGGQSGGSMPMSVLAVPVGAAQGEPYVPVLIEVEGERFAAGTQGGVLPAEIYGYAIDSRGSIRDFFTQVIGIDLAKYGEQLRQTGFKFWGELDLEPGEYAVRVLVRNGSTGATSVDVVELAVPNPSGTSAMLLPPLFPEPMGKWIMAREENRTERSTGFPFIMQGEAFFPASRPLVASSQASTICLMSVDLAGRSVDLSGRLLDAEQTEVEGTQVALESLTGDGLADQVCSPVQISVTGPSSGDYLLEVTAQDSASGDHWSSTIPIALGG